MMNLLLTVTGAALGIALLADMVLGLWRTFHYLADRGEREPEES